MRSELGKITLDKTFEERDTLNENIVCLRYEIRDISPPSGMRTAMEMQAEAERRKHAQVLESEGERQANINIADGKKVSVILESEAAMMDQVNRAKGEAEAILAKAQATAEGIEVLSDTIKASGGVEAASLRIAEQYIEAFGNTAQQATTLLLPSTAENPSSMMAQAMTIYKSLVGNDLRSRPSSVSQSRFTYDDIGDGSNRQAEYQSPASDASTVTSPNAFSPHPRGCASVYPCLHQASPSLSKHHLLSFSSFLLISPHLGFEFLELIWRVGFSSEVVGLGFHS
ncbi:hypothetical protein AAC387_Pa08g1716 [Persea americana]